MSKKTTIYPSETQERFIVRFPDGMRDNIAEAAKANNRSMNAEIVDRLQSSFEPASSSGSDLVLDQAQQIWELRQILAVAHMELAKAADALVKRGDAQHGEAIRMAMEKTLPAAKPVLDQVLQDAVHDWKLRDQASAQTLASPLRGPIAGSAARTVLLSEPGGIDPELLSMVEPWEKAAITRQEVAGGQSRPAPPPPPAAPTKRRVNIRRGG